ncbi:MAG: DUF2156 domain-containing protein [Actinomycetaceae bacterium]|nr:DUF2156 domain-containing protein [Actinomycetaceae bacterium]MDY6083448.1 DUF2156 domain-containing protein [Actinomycetaceae bacterium]
MNKVSGWLTGLAKGTKRIVVSAPVSCVLLVTMWVLFVVYEGNHAALKAALGLAAHGDLRFVRLFTSGLTSASLAGVLSSTLGVIIFSFAAERRLGSARFAVVGIASQFVFVPLGLWLAPMPLTGSSFLHPHFGADIYLSPVAWMYGTIACATAWMSTLWKRRIRLVIFTVCVTQVLFIASVTNVVGLTAAVGSMIASTIVKGEKVFHRPVASVRERRVLVAFLIAAVAIAPLLGGLHPHSLGVFTRTSAMIWQPFTDPSLSQTSCAAYQTIQCQALTSLRHMRGLGFFLQNLMLILVQLVLAYGLVRAKRAAWIGSVAAQIVIIVSVLGQLAYQRAVFSSGLSFVMIATVMLIPWIVSIVLLLRTRALFTSRVSSQDVRTFVRRLAGGLAASIVVWGVGMVIVLDQLRPRPTVEAMIAEFPARLLPPITAASLPTHFVPTSRAGWTVFAWTGIVFWAVCALALFALIGFARTPHSAVDQRRARQILEHGSGDHLSFMTLWHGNSYFFHSLGYVAYRVHGGVAVTLGEPVLLADHDSADSRGSHDLSDGNSDGVSHDAHDHDAQLASSGELQEAPQEVSDSERLDELAAAFEHFASAHGWIVAWYSVRESFVRPGFHSLHVAEESMLDTSVKFTGKKFQNVRTARNNAKKEGIEAVWTQWSDLSVEMREKVVTLSEEWVAQKALPEMGFTLGTVDELSVEGTKLLLAVGPDERLHAVTSWLPVYQEGSLVGYTLDVMRRDSRGFRSSIEFLLGEIVPVAVQMGIEWVSLSGAPLAPSHDEQESQTNVVQQALQKTGTMMEPLYGFRALAASKEKFCPTHGGWYLKYRDELSLGSIGLAVVACYLPRISGREARRAAMLWVKSLRR